MIANMANSGTLCGTVSGQPNVTTINCTARYARYVTIYKDSGADTVLDFVEVEVYSKLRYLCISLSYLPLNIT